MTREPDGQVRARRCGRLRAASRNPPTGSSSRDGDFEEHLNAALVTRPTIGQAKGVLVSSTATIQVSVSVSWRWVSAQSASGEDRRGPFPVSGTPNCVKQETQSKLESGDYGPKQ